MKRNFAKTKASQQAALIAAHRELAEAVRLVLPLVGFLIPTGPLRAKEKTLSGSEVSKAFTPQEYRLAQCLHEVRNNFDFVLGTSAVQLVVTAGKEVRSRAADGGEGHLPADWMPDRLEKYLAPGDGIKLWGTMCHLIRKAQPVVPGFNYSTPARFDDMVLEKTSQTPPPASQRRPSAP